MSCSEFCLSKDTRMLFAEGAVAEEMASSSLWKEEGELSVEALLVDARGIDNEPGEGFLGGTHVAV